MCEVKLFGNIALLMFYFGARVVLCCSVLLVVWLMLRCSTVVSVGMFGFDVMVLWCSILD